MPSTEARVLHWLMILIAASTIVAGVGQLVAPGFVLDVLNASSTPTTRHFFAIVGMFMSVIGGALLHSLLSPGDHRVLLMWAAVQKFGAFVAVSIGVLNDIFSGLGIAVALNDLLSAGVIVWYMRRGVTRPARRPTPTSEVAVR